MTKHDTKKYCIDGLEQYKVQILPMVGPDVGFLIQSYINYSI